MPHIVKLSPHVANLIAAGEVVERPASVVKELVENAVDALAEKVTVEIENGGITSIRITDDGCGIAREDARTAFLRHATSKLHSEEDLLSGILTYGFRGEALAAIAAVSRIDLFTKERGEVLGTHLMLEAGEIRAEEDAGCPEGTTILVRDLFFNTPARMKFLKRDATEAGYIASAVSHAALSRPDVSFRLIRDGKEQLHTAGDGSLKNAVYAVYGREFLHTLIPVSASCSGIEVSGFISKPELSRANRTMQNFFVNGRPIRSPLMQAALEQAYRNRIMTGRFPACVLRLTLSAQNVDVNVHPAKTEVKFSVEKGIFDAVYMAVKSALDHIVAPVEAVLGDPVRQRPAVRGEDNLTHAQERMISELPEEKEPAPQALPHMPAPPEPIRQGRAAPVQQRGFSAPVVQRSPYSFTMPEQYAPARPLSAPEPRAFESEKPSVNSDAGVKAVSTSVPERETVPPAPPASAPEWKSAPEPPAEPPTSPAPPQEAWRLVGEVLGTYLVVDDGEGMLLIDQHAAHERILFNRLKAQGGAGLRQLLLTPVVVPLSREDYAAAVGQIDQINALGFDAADFGDRSLVVRQAPDYVAADEVAVLIEELAGKLREYRSVEADLRDELLHTAACKAAVKGGMHLTPEEQRALVEQVMTDDDVRYCPHGRPVAIYYSKYQLEKQFKRIQ